MKKTAMLLAICLLIGLLNGCGAAETKSEQPADSVPTATQTPMTETPKPTANPTPKPTEAPVSHSDLEPIDMDEIMKQLETAEPASENEQLETAKSFIGKTTTELYAAIGMPEESDYAPSCLGPGEDGNLYYDGFTVYTYRENGVETVRIVE